MSYGLINLGSPFKVVYSASKWILRFVIENVNPSVNARILVTLTPWFRGRSRQPWESSWQSCKNVPTVPTSWCYFFWPVLIFGKNTRKQAKTRENRRKTGAFLVLIFWGEKLVGANFYAFCNYVTSPACVEHFLPISTSTSSTPPSSWS